MRSLLFALVSFCVMVVVAAPVGAKEVCPVTELPACTCLMHVNQEVEWNNVPSGYQVIITFPAPGPGGYGCCLIPNSDCFFGSPCSYSDRIRMSVYDENDDPVDWLLVLDSGEAFPFNGLGGVIPAFTASCGEKGKTYHMRFSGFAAFARVTLTCKRCEADPTPPPGQ